MAVQLERLSNSEIQKLYAKNKAMGKSVDIKHMQRLKQQHEQARGNHRVRHR